METETMTEAPLDTPIGTEPAAAPATPVDLSWPEPEGRCRGDVSGVPVRLGGGEEWFLVEPGLAPLLTELRDRLYDSIVTRQAVLVTDVYKVAWILLQANYQLTDEELARLILGAEQEGLIEATLDALFGRELSRPGYTEWALTGLLAAGLDPVTIPPARLPGVLSHLVGTGRVLPQDSYIGSAKHAAKRAKLARIAGG